MQADTGRHDVSVRFALQGQFKAASRPAGFVYQPLDVRRQSAGTCASILALPGVSKARAVPCTGFND